ncbi:hypothetical protein V8G54_009552 [Vigna mungo]|uniref:Uncharacterized protein n=1 Tax=Vigna mungo TaxID=3915 RepID=A0AAQ3NWD2_VIGMU
MKQKEIKIYKNDDKRRNQIEAYTPRLSGTHGILAFSIGTALSTTRTLALRLFGFSISSNRITTPTLPLRQTTFQLPLPTLAPHQNFSSTSRVLSAQTLADYMELFF